MDSNKQTFLEQDSEMKPNMQSNKKKKRKRFSKDPCEPKSKNKQIMSEKQKKTSVKGKRTKMCDIYNDAEDQYMCLERAAFFLERLDAELPKFAKCMLPSNVLYSFWLILPKKFCVMHFPDDDSTIILVDESGKEFKTNYLKARHGLSAGWRGFTTAQRLLQGDILFFRLIEPCKLQVNIVRRYSLEEMEAAVCLMEMHPRVKKSRTSNYFEKSTEAKKEKLKHKEVKEEDEDDFKNQTPLPIQMIKGKRTRRIPKKCFARLSLDFCSTHENVEENSDTERVSSIDQCGVSSDGLSSEVVQGINVVEDIQKMKTLRKLTRKKEKKRTLRELLVANSSSEEGVEEEALEEEEKELEKEERVEKKKKSMADISGMTSTTTNETQTDEVGCYKLNLSLHEGNINCHSTAERIFHSSTLAT